MKLAKVVTILCLMTFSCIASEWNHTKSSFDPRGEVQLKDSTGATWNLNNDNAYKGYSTTASPTVLSVTYTSSVDEMVFNNDITPKKSDNSVVFNEPLIVGQAYEFYAQNYRTGGSGTKRNYACWPVIESSNVVIYTGPGQVIEVMATCQSARSDYNAFVSKKYNFKVVNDTTIEGYVVGPNTYYGYEGAYISMIKKSSLKTLFYRFTDSTNGAKSVLREPLVIGSKYKIQTYYSYSGGSSHIGYRCTPIILGTQTFTYTGPGQQLNISSSCEYHHDGVNLYKGTFTIVDDKNIEGYIFAPNTYYGVRYSMVHKVVKL